MSTWSETYEQETDPRALLASLREKLIRDAKQVRSVSQPAAIALNQIAICIGELLIERKEP